MNRQQRRALGKQLGQESTQTLDLMLSLEKCLICEKKYDKKSRQDAMTWHVDVYKKEKRVDLYCPECQEKRKNAGSSNV